MRNVVDHVDSPNKCGFQSKYISSAPLKSLALNQLHYFQAFDKISNRKWCMRFIRAKLAVFRIYSVDANNLAHWRWVQKYPIRTRTIFYLTLRLFVKNRTRPHSCAKRDKIWIEISHELGVNTFDSPLTIL